MTADEYVRKVEWLPFSEWNGSAPQGKNPEELRDEVWNALAGLPDLLYLEQYLDFLRNRTFRRTLLCHEHQALNREPSPKELDLALSYLEKGTLAQYAQALLATNEVIFWP